MTGSGFDCAGWHAAPAVVKSVAVGAACMSRRLLKTRAEVWAAQWVYGCVVGSEQRPSHGVVPRQAGDHDGNLFQVHQ